jgi:biotin synthase
MDPMALIDELYEKNNLSDEGLLYLLDHMDQRHQHDLVERAHDTRMRVYGNRVFMRGLIEFTNYCKRNCTYCGIRRDNDKAERYRLTPEQIMKSAETGYALGFRTYVLQGGEDPYFTDERLVEIIEAIKARFPDTALTLSVGERSRESYRRLFDAGADRYLLRHETASRELYEKLHPDMSYDDRHRCLLDLKDIGYQVGAGFMVGLPGQGNKHLVEDLRFLKSFRPHMVGIGPFIPHHDTLLKEEPAGTVSQTVTLLAMVRLLLPEVLLPATTALGSLDNLGREMGIQAGANVVMPNLSPTEVRDKYLLYDGKICTGDEAAECRKCIEGRITQAGFAIDMTRGDHPGWRV